MDQRNQYLITEFPFEFDDRTPIALSKTFRVGVLRKVPQGQQGFSVFVESLKDGATVLQLDQETVALLRRSDKVVWVEL